jgi:hypothetical protein
MLAFAFLVLCMIRGGMVVLFVVTVVLGKMGL